jgi:ribulose 1,5-bisphosphate synthetase/thiazole synthase
MLCRALGRMRAQKFRNFCTAPGERLKVAVVGSGPGGFYTARTLLKKHPGIKIDIVEMLPVPFGEHWHRISLLQRLWRWVPILDFCVRTRVRA